MDYWDTSCLLKLYCLEPDSETYLQLAEKSQTPLTTSILAKTEFIHAVRQKAARKDLSKAAARKIITEFQSDIDSGHITLLPLGADVLAKAESIAEECLTFKNPVFLRTLDGIHLATAQIAKCKQLITTDQRMREAAGLLGPG